MYGLELLLIALSTAIFTFVGIMITYFVLWLISFFKM